MISKNRNKCCEKQLSCCNLIYLNRKEWDMPGSTGTKLCFLSPKF